MARKAVNPVEAYLSADPVRTREHPGDALIDHTKYVDLKQIAQILDRSALRVRKIVNSGGIASTRREGKIFCLKQDVMKYKAEKLAKRSNNKQARLERSKKRVIRATSTIGKLVQFDAELTDEEKQTFLDRLSAYQQAAKKAISS